MASRVLARRHVRLLAARGSSRAGGKAGREHTFRFGRGQGDGVRPGGGHGQDRTPSAPLPTATSLLSRIAICSLLAMSDTYVAHRVIRRIAGWAVVSFFTEIHVVGGENVPKDGPIIV